MDPLHNAQDARRGVGKGVVLRVVLEPCLQTEGRAVHLGADTPELGEGVGLLGQTPLKLSCPLQIKGTDKENLKKEGESPGNQL